MTQDLKGLIDRIQQEGVGAAQAKADVIEQEARRKAETMVAEAEVRAKKFVTDAETRIRRMEESAKTTLCQAGRDMLISVKKEIESLLGKIVAQQVRDALNPGELAGIIARLVVSGGQQGEVVVSVSREDLTKLEGGFMPQLQAAVRRGMTLRASDDIKAGFVISFDAGRSQFDFTEKALADYMVSALKPKLKEYLES